MTGRTWNYHDMSLKALKNANVCSAQVLAGSHFRQKRPHRRYTTRCTSRAEDHTLPRDDCNGDLGVFCRVVANSEWPARAGSVSIHIDLPKVVIFSFSLSETVCGSPRCLGQTIWSHASQNMWGNGWSVHHDFWVGVLVMEHDEVQGH